MAILEVKNLSRSFGGLRAVNNVSFDVEEGTIKAVIGPNGAGKTTLFNLIAGAIAPDSGEIRYKGASIFGLPPYRVAGRGISRTFQNTKLFTNMTVLENIMVGRHTRSRSGFMSSMLSPPWTRREEREIRQKAEELAGLLGIGDALDTDAGKPRFRQAEVRGDGARARVGTGAPPPRRTGRGSQHLRDEGAGRTHHENQRPRASPYS